MSVDLGLQCGWVEDEDSNWYTSCLNKFILLEGPPIENGMVFCCYCGKSLVEHPYKEDEDEQKP